MRKKRFLKILFPSRAPSDSPHFLFSFGLSTGRFREQNIHAPEENACTAGYEKFNLVPGARLDVRASLSPTSLENSNQSFSFLKR